MQNLVIIGASGFIGTNLLKKLNNTNIHIIAVSLNKSDFPFFLKSENIIYEDYETFAKRKEALNDYIVINFAYTRSVIVEDIEDSKSFTYKVSETIKNLNIKKYIYISTQSVYDEQRTKPAKETDPVLPATVYGEGKVNLENWLIAFTDKNNMDLIILRLASVVGEGMEQRITSRFVDYAIRSEQIKIVDSGQVFSFIHINDLVEALISFLRCFSRNDLKIKNEIYNLGTDENYFLIDIANTIKNILGKYGKTVNIIVEKQEGKYKNNSVNMLKTFETLKWRPKYRLKDIVQEDIERELKR